jgi:hypothetical protein
MACRVADSTDRSDAPSSLTRRLAMKRCIVVALTAALAVIVTAPFVSGVRECAAAEKAPQLAHIVFFELKEPTDAAREKLIAGCKEYLSGHEGAVYFSVGSRAEELDREVNDKTFHVALHIVFANKAAHDRYATHERHLEFIEECKDLWSNVRVFDSYLVAGSKGAGAKKEPKEGGESGAEKRAKGDPPAKIPLPDQASGFAGMIEGKVVEKRGNQIVVLVGAVPKTWEHNKAPDAQSMVGKKVLVLAPKGTEGEKQVARFVKMVEVGESLALDVAHKGGEALTVLELTEEQRERVKGDVKADVKGEK